MTKFKVGDRVRMTSRVSGHGYQIGSIVTITEVVSNTYYRGDIVFETRKWAFTDNECELVQPDAIKLKLKRL